MSESMLDLNSVQEFFAGKTILVTGASGLIGKVLIEKLLYSCSDVEELMILMSAKKGKCDQQRTEQFTKHPVSV
jgi:alcohol-forming fatty acyl-CoA reductase